MKSNIIKIGLSIAAVAGMAATQASALDCPAETLVWNAGTSKSCSFTPFPGATVTASATSLSGTDSLGRKGIIADLTAKSAVPSGWELFARATGIATNGQPMSPSFNFVGCETGKDFSTAQGATVGDGNDCEQGHHHRLVVTLRQIPRIPG